MKTIIATRARACALALAAATAAMPALAAPPPAGGSLIGGSALLGEGMHGQLERWLGAGPLDLTNVYTRQAGDTADDFHAGADGRGATFTLLGVTNAEGERFLVGGYNPQSWSSSEGWHETERDWQRTAFLFNFTEPAVYRQVLSSYVLPSQGQRQTFNEAGFGPVFGSGPDLFVNDRLDLGLSWQLSYGNPADEGISIIDRGAGGATVRIDGMEILAITPVPEAGAYAMWLAGLAGLAGYGMLGGAGRLGRERAKCAKRALA